MKTVEYWRWMTWQVGGEKKTITRHHMNEETALARHPEAVKVPGTMELREVCETPEDLLLTMNTRPK